MEGTATPYPSTINVTGMVGQPVGLRVRLKNFSHTFTHDVAVLLVAPNGQGIELLSRNGGNARASGLTVTFGAESTTPLPQPLITGVFSAAGGNNGFAAPANAIPRAASLGAFIAGSPNGQWRLFVQDFAPGDTGSIAGGWELEFGDFGLPTTPLTPSTLHVPGPPRRRRDHQHHRRPLQPLEPSFVRCPCQPRRRAGHSQRHRRHERPVHHASEPRRVSADGHPDLASGGDLQPRRCAVCGPYAAPADHRNTAGWCRASGRPRHQRRKHAMVRPDGSSLRSRQLRHRHRHARCPHGDQRRRRRRPAGPREQLLPLGPAHR